MSVTAKNTYTPIKLWLYALVGMVLLMVLIGGVTRLTDSGLSMTNWKPITGIIPPMNDSEWLKEFSEYKKFPEFKKINFEMKLDEFKRIYFWEYFHRLFGRLIGLVFLIPFVVFLLKKEIDKKLFKKLIIGFILGGLQGLMGWYMVKSGLVDRPDVSHFRLAAHLSLAFLIISYLYWLSLELAHPNRVYVTYKSGQKLGIFALLLLITQIVLGAFVAGLDAGLTHNTFPKMGREWIPAELYEIPFVEWFDSMLSLQFLHRSFGWALLAMAAIIAIKRHKTLDFMQKKSIYILSFMIFIQFLLGVLTLIYFVPISFASLHQIGACVALLLLIRYLYFTYTDLSNNSKKITQ